MLVNSNNHMRIFDITLLIKMSFTINLMRFSPYIELHCLLNKTKAYLTVTYTIFYEIIVFILIMMDAYTSQV